MQQKTDFTTFYMRQSFPLFAAWIVLVIIRAILPNWGIIGMIIGILYITIFFSMAFFAWNAYRGKKFSHPELEKLSNQMIKACKLESFFAPEK